MADGAEYVKNPLTGRQIKVGGELHRKLVREGRLALGAPEPGEEAVDIGPARVLGDLYVDNAANDKLIRKWNARLPDNEQAVRGRGAYAGKLVVRRVTKGAFSKPMPRHYRLRSPSPPPQAKKSPPASSPTSSGWGSDSSSAYHYSYEYEP